MTEAEKLVGVELTNKSIELEGENLVGKVGAQHVGKIGYLKINVEGGIQFKPLAYQAIDFVEQKIPGDQTAFAAIAKAAIDKIKIKF